MYSASTARLRRVYGRVILRTLSFLPTCGARRQPNHIFIILSLPPCSPVSALLAIFERRNLSSLPLLLSSPLPLFTSFCSSSPPALPLPSPLRQLYSCHPPPDLLHHAACRGEQGQRWHAYQNMLSKQKHFYRWRLKLGQTGAERLITGEKEGGGGCCACSSKKLCRGC